MFFSATLPPEILRVAAVGLMREHHRFDLSARNGDDAIANGRLGDWQDPFGRQEHEMSYEYIWDVWTGQKTYRTRQGTPI